MKLEDASSIPCPCLRERVFLFGRRSGHGSQQFSCSLAEQFSEWESECEWEWWGNDGRSVHQVDSFVLVERKEVQRTLEVVPSNVSSIRWTRWRKKGIDRFSISLTANRENWSEMLERDSLEQSPRRCSQLLFRRPFLRHRDVSGAVLPHRTN